MALNRKKRATPAQEKILDDEKEARLIALSRSEPLKGHARWTLRLLADKLVELGIVESISHKTVRKMLRKWTAENPRFSGQGNALCPTFRPESRTAIVLSYRMR